MNELLINQATSFPHGHDDMVDVLCYSIETLLGSTGSIKWYL